MSALSRACRRVLASRLAASAPSSSFSRAAEVSSHAASIVRASAPAPRARAFAADASPGTFVDRYNTAAGPMAGLLRALRDHGEMTTRELFERATASGTQTHSMRHAKGLLKKMKELDRVRARPPKSEGGEGVGRRKGRGNFTYSITERGLAHVEKLDRAAGSGGDAPR